MNDLIDRVATECCSTFAPASVARPVPAQASQPLSELVAVIGFSGDQLKGAIGLCASLEDLAATHPSAIAGEPTTLKDLEDWIGESANQLLGRLKSQFQRYGLAMWMGTPLVLRGISVAVATTDDNVRRFALDLGGGRTFTFWLDMEIDPAALSDAYLRPNEEPQPGEFLMF